MNELRWPARCFIGALALAALGVVLWTLPQGGGPNRGAVALALAFGGLATFAGLFPLPCSFKTKLYLDTSVVVASVLLLEPGLAMLVAGGGTGLAHAVRRQPPVETLFNAAQAALAAAAGGFVLSLGGWPVDDPPFGRPEQVALIVLATLTMTAVNDLLVATMVGLQAGLAPWRVWVQALLHADLVDHVVHLNQVGAGVMVAVLVDAQPWTLVLPLLPVGAVFRTLARDLDRRRRTEAVLRDTEAALAEAQRIARLGSWDWDLATGEQVWSDEVYRIFGLVPQAAVPTFDAFLSCVHPDDRAALDQAVHHALYTGEPFSLDHRIRRPDGSERTVHEHGEVIFDADGRKSRIVGTIHDISERKSLEARLAHQAFHDPLTDLPNRALFTDRVAHALARTRRQRTPIAVLFVDLDRFKGVNDALGHDAGDRLLVAVAERLRACSRPGDTVARLGGDEFTVLLEDITRVTEATAVAARISEALQAPFALADQELTVTASVGIALSRPEHGSPADLLRDADIALYRAKANGRAGYELFDPSMATTARATVGLEADLRRALERNQFRVHYQPVVALATGRTSEVEALVRWQHPERGLLGPGEFVPLAEETGLIVPLGRWVLAEACRQARAWHEHAPATAPVVSVNVSARQFRQADLVGEVARTLRQTGLNPRRLQLEITESAMLEDAEGAIATLRQLRQIGVRVAIDDFGTGYSSLGSLRRLPVDTLKLDRSFVVDLVPGSVETTITAAVIDLGHALGLQVVAEGVERADQLHRLRALGCHAAQGYYLAKPLPPPAAPIDLLPSTRAEPRCHVLGTLVADR